MTPPRLEGPRVILEPQTEADVALRLRWETDDALMRHLGGARPRDAIERAHASSLVEAADGTGWPLKIMFGGVAVGTIGIFRSQHAGEAIFEMGWVMGREHQGLGLAAEAATVMVEAARTRGAFPALHAFPPVTNPASNRICEKVGCELLGTIPLDYGGHPLICNHWRVVLT